MPTGKVLKIRLKFIGDTLVMRRTEVPFQEEYPQLDISEVRFVYDRGDLRLVTTDSEQGWGLDVRLRSWMDARPERITTYPNTYSKSPKVIVIEFSPDHDHWVLFGGYARIRDYSFEELKGINRDRLRSIAELQEFFEQDIDR